MKGFCTVRYLLILLYGVLTAVGYDELSASVEVFGLVLGIEYVLLLCPVIVTFFLSCVHLFFFFLVLLTHRCDAAMRTWPMISPRSDCASPPLAWALLREEKYPGIDTDNASILQMLLVVHTLQCY